MTKDEAIRLLWVDKNLCRSNGYTEAKDFVEKLEALGVISLDRRKTRMERICTVLQEWRSAETEGANAFLNRLESSGLEITEKENSVRER